MMEKRLDNCRLLHIYKDVTDSIDLVQIAKEFIVIGLTDEHKNHFGSFPL